MKIGYSQTSITPALDKPVYLAGFGNNRRAETVHDELTVRALAIQSGGSTLVLAALDLIGFFRPDVQDVIRSVQASELIKDQEVSIIIASTHTHHGPDSMGLWGPDDKTRGVDQDYLASIKNKIEAVILAALASLKPAAIASTSVHVPGLVKNARDPQIVDDELTLAQFNSDTGKPLVTLFNFPCHPEVLWEHNPHITADYPGVLRSEVEKQTGAPCIFFPGALGGMLTPDVKDHSFEEAEFMGRALARAGLSALSSVDSHALEGFSVQKKEIKAKLTNILYKLAFARKLLPDVRDRQGCVNSEVNLIKLGDLWLAAVPGELLPKLGLQLKAQMITAGAVTAGVIGLANDELGYILPVEDFKYPWNPFKPGSHYEETNSVGRGIAPSIMEGLRELL